MGRRHGTPILAGFGGNVDYPPVAAVSHSRQHRLAEVELSLQIHREDCVPLFRGNRLDRMEWMYPGIVHENLNSAETLLDLGYELAHGPLVGDVYHPVDYLHLGGIREPICTLRKRVHLDVTHGHPGSAVCELQRDRLSNASCGTGHNCRMTVKLHFFLLINPNRFKTSVNVRPCAGKNRRFVNASPSQRHAKLLYLGWSEALIVTPPFPAPRFQAVTDRYLGVRREDGGELSRGENNIRINSLHGLVNSAVVNLVGPFTAIFAMRIGANELDVALLTSGPAIVSLVAMIPGAIMIDRLDRKKDATFRWMIGNRIGYLLLACVPFFAPREQASLFVLLLALMNLPGAISNIAWQAFISRIVPPEKRSRAFASRNRLMNLFGTAVTVVTGIFLDGAKFPLGYQLTFVGAFCLAALEMAVFRRIDEDAVPKKSQEVGTGQPVPEPIVLSAAQPPQATTERRYFLAIRFNTRMGALFLSRANEILSERRFVYYTLVSVFFYLAWQTPWPLFSWYQVRILHANNLWVSLLAVMNTGGALVGYGYWQRMLDRRGNLATLFVSSFPIFIVPLVYAFSESLLTIGIANLIIGAIFSGVNLALFNTLLEMTPETKKASFLAYYTTAVTLASVLAPLIGVGLLSIMGFRDAFIVCALFRLAGSLAFLVMMRSEAKGLSSLSSGDLPVGK